MINEKSFTVFVMDAHRIFVNSWRADASDHAQSASIGVIAHETGHIVGGHLSKMRQELANAQTAAIVAMLLGIGAMVAGSRSSNGMGNAGAAIVSAPQSYLQHTLLAYQRAQEEQADRTGVRFLTMTGQSAKGMYDTFKRFADEMMFSASYIDPYAQNHPMPAERMAALAELVKTQYWDKKDPPELQFRHEHDAGEALNGFTERPDEAVLRRTIRHPTTSIPRPLRARHLRLRVSATCAPRLPQIDGQ